MTNGIPVVLINDVTTELIGLMTGGSSPDDDYATNSLVFGTSADALSGVADWVQVLGTAEGPLAQATAAAVLAEIRANGANAEAGAAAAEAASAGVGTAAAGLWGFILLIASFILNMLFGDGGDSTEVLLFKAIQKALGQISDQNIVNYWQSKIADVNNYWDPPGGDGPAVYLNNLASQGTNGDHVAHDVSNWHNAAFAFIMALTTDPGAPQYWRVEPEPGFVPQQADFTPAGSWWNPDASWQISTWYGQFPERSLAPGSPGDSLLDPTTMLPLLTLAIHSDLILESLANTVPTSPPMPTLDVFLSEYGSSYTAQPSTLLPSGGFLYVFYSQYSLAVGGITMTDLPSDYEILGFLWAIAQTAGAWASPDTNPGQATNQSWGAPCFEEPFQPPCFSGNGYAWNGLYGAAQVYPQYGFYAEPRTDDLWGSWPFLGGELWPGMPLTTSSLFTPEYIVSGMGGPGFVVLATAGDWNEIVAQWWRAGILYNQSGSAYVSMAWLYDWVIPWLQNLLIFGRMARWKAIYLINSYDKLWAMLQTLQQITKPDSPIVPPVMTFQDNTGTTYRADGNWSARELISVIKVNNFMKAAGIKDPTESVTTGFWEWGYSVETLAQFLYNVGYGAWGGPWNYQLGGPPVPPPLRPLSLRELLTLVAS